MSSFVRVALVMMSVHSNKTPAKTSYIGRSEQESWRLTSTGHVEDVFINVTFHVHPPKSDIIIMLFELIRKLDISQVKLFSLK